jgi:hypothetical protein
MTPSGNAKLYNERWLIERHGDRTPAQVRRAMKGVSPAVA